MSSLIINPNDIRLQNASNGLITPALRLAGIDVPVSDALDREYYYLESKIALARPVFTKWQPGRQFAGVSLGAGASIVGANGGAQLKVPATAGRTAQIYNSHVQTVNQRGHCLPGTSSKTWGLTIRFGLSNTPPASVGYSFFGFSNGVDFGPAVGYYNVISAANFSLYFSAGKTVDLGVALNATINTFRMWRLNEAGTYKTYAELNGATVINGSTTAYPDVSATFDAYVNTGEAVAKNAECYWVACLAPEV